MMNLDQIRLNQNPVLTNILLGLGQGTLIAESLFPRLPQALSSIQLAQLGDERFRRYNLRRAPGGATKRVNIRYEGKVYSVDQYSVEVPIPRELIREAEAMKTMHIGANLDLSRIAMVTANDVLCLDYEIETAAMATNPATYAAGNTLALAGGTKWSSPTGTPVTDILAASEVVRKKIGKRPNKLTFSADAWQAFRTNKEVKTYLPLSQLGPSNVEQAKVILNVGDIEIGDAVWIDETNVSRDVWGNNCILAYVPKIGAGGANISLAEPAFGFTNVIEGHPYAEAPYYDTGSKSWVYGATYERRANVAYSSAAFLLQNPK